jgi:glycosyltransferase involved in cell wall biosynthesis
MRILVITPDGFGGHGGIAQYNRDALTALCAYASPAEVVAIPRVAPMPMHALPANLRWVTTGLGGKLRYLRALLRELWSRRDYDLVVCTHVHLLPFAFLAKLACRARLLLFVFGFEVWQPTKHPSANLLASKVDGYVYIRSLTAARFRRWAALDGIKSHLLPNAIHPDSYGVAPKSKELLERYRIAGKPVVMTIGRLDASEPRRGFDEVLEAMPRVLKEVPDAMYFIAGGGDDEARLKEMARALKVDEHVIFAGFIPEQEKAEHIRLADVVAMPGSNARFDRYPIRFSYLEAMACGIPVVASRPEVPEEVEEARALEMRLVDPADPKETAAAIVHFLKNPRRRIPDGLGRLSYPSFERKIAEIVNDVMEI